MLIDIINVHLVSVFNTINKKKGKFYSKNKDNIYYHKLHRTLQKCLIEKYFLNTCDICRNTLLLYLQLKLQKNYFS